MHHHAMESARALAKEGFCGGQLFTVCVRDKLGDVVEANKHMTTGGGELVAHQPTHLSRMQATIPRPRAFYVVFDTAPTRTAGAADMLAELAAELAVHVLHVRLS